MTATTPGECFAGGHLLNVMAAAREIEGGSGETRCVNCPRCGALWIFGTEEESAR